MNKKDVINKLDRLPLKKDEYWVAAGSAMVLYGIRNETHDIDLGCTKAAADKMADLGYKFTHTSDGKRYFLIEGDIEIFEDWLFDTVTIVDGYPVITINGLIEMKKWLGREKDFKDIALINDFLKRGQTKL